MKRDNELQKPLHIRTTPTIERALQRASCAREHCHARWLNKGPTILRSRPSVDKLATPLRINKSLAFRAFDKTIIFGHWLPKTQKLALASGAFLFEKGFYYILVDNFQKSKNAFQKGVWGIFMGLYNFPHMLYNFPSHAKHRVAKFNFHYTFICFHIYIYIYISAMFGKSLSPSSRIAWHIHPFWA